MKIEFIEYPTSDEVRISTANKTYVFIQGYDSVSTSTGGGVTHEELHVLKSLLLKEPTSNVLAHVIEVALKDY